MREFLTQRVLHLAAILFVTLSVLAWGQVNIQVRPGFAVPRDKVYVLFNTTCRVVAEEFRLRDISDVQIPVTLVIGDPVTEWSGSRPGKFSRSTCPAGTKRCLPLR